jgi:mRNA interferase MazF
MAAIKSASGKTVRRGEVWIVRFGPAEGAEINKSRPALILQNDAINRHAPTTLLAPITSSVSGGRFLTNVEIAAGEGGLAHDSEVRLTQIRCMDKLRLGKRLGKVSEETMQKVDEAMIFALGVAT